MATTSSYTSKSFSITNKNLKLNSKEDIDGILSDLKNNIDVEDIHFSGNTIGVEAAQALAVTLKCLKNLKVSVIVLSIKCFINCFQIADFSDIFTGRLITEIPSALKSICDALLDCENLEEVNLSDNAFGGRSAEPMVNLLSHHKNLNTLKLNNNGLGIEGGKIVAGALSTLADNHKSKLKTVICGRNRLENGSSNEWALAFSKHAETLECIKMPQNGIRPEGITNIVNGLKDCKNLQELDLQDNTLTKVGSLSVSNIMKNLTSLKVLNLSDCLTGGKGGIEIGKVLASGYLKNLEILRLQFNEWDERALKFLSEFVEKFGQKLSTLEINGNRADPDDDVIESIREHLSNHGHPNALDELDEMEEYDPEDLEEDEDEQQDDEDKESGDEQKDEKPKDDEKQKDEKASGIDDLADQLAGTKI